MGIKRIHMDEDSCTGDHFMGVEHPRHIKALKEVKAQMTKKGFVKHDDGKPRPSLLPPLALLSISRVLTHGAKKYDDENWAKTKSIRRYADAAQRHLLLWQAGEDIDPESGETHIACAMCSLLFIEELTQRGMLDGIDDRFTRCNEDLSNVMDFLVGGSRKSEYPLHNDSLEDLKK